MEALTTGEGVVTLQAVVPSADEVDMLLKHVSEGFDCADTAALKGMIHSLAIIREDDDGNCPNAS